MSQDLVSSPGACAVAPRVTLRMCIVGLLPALLIAGCPPAEDPDPGRSNPAVSDISDDHSNSISGATRLTVGDSASGSIETAADVDCFSFSGEQGWAYAIETSGSTDTYVTLYDTDASTELASDDDHGESSNARIEWTPPADGTYYVCVRHCASDGTGAYQLSVEGTAPPADDHGDTPARGSHLSVGESVEGSIDVAGDVDYFSFSGEQGWAYVIETAGSTDTYLTLCDTDGSTELASDDDDGDSDNARIEWTAPADSTYYIRVRHFSSTGTGTYRLSVTGEAPPGGTLVVNTDPDDPLIALVEKDGEWLMLHGQKDVNGDILDLHSVTYRVSPEAEAFTLTFGDDGLPSNIVTGGWTFHFSNWRDDRVDCMIVNPSGDAGFVEDVEADPQYVATLRALWTEGGSQPARTAKSIHASSSQSWWRKPVGWGLRIASYAVDCVGGTIERAAQGAVVVPVIGAVPGAVVGAVTGCGTALLSAVADLTGNETLGAFTTVLGVAQCMAQEYSSCGAVALDLWADTFFQDHEDHQSTESTFSNITGQLRGVVRNAATRSPLSGARVRVLRQQQVVSGGMTDANGRYEITLPAGTDYRLEVSKDGYLPVMYFGAEVAARQTADLETLLQIESRYVGSGSISGTVTNAFDGTAVSDALIRFRSGQNARQGTVVFSTTANSVGYYVVSSVQSGVYTGEVTASGFLTGYFTVTVLGGTSVGDQSIGLSPQLTAGEIRIVLTWGASPSDLDSHLTGPLSDGSRFHVYFRSKGSSSGEPYAALDHDDTTSYGPETITIYIRRSGTYRYTVHDYSNWWSTSSTALANAGAEVKVYGAAGLVATFSVPPEGGTAWTVFELDGNSGGITAVNAMSYVSSASDIANRARMMVGFEDLLLLRNLPSK